MLHGLIALEPAARRFIVHPMQVFVASAKAGSYLSPFRKRVTFRAHLVEQDGTGLLMPSDDHLLGLVFIPLALISITIGAYAGFVS